MATTRSTGGPTLLDAAALLVETADELLLRGVRDTHAAVGRRVQRVVDPPTAGLGAVPGAAHRGIASGVYAGLGLAAGGLRVALDRAARSGAGPRLEDTGSGRFLNAAVNGLIGDRLAEERPRLAIPMAVRRRGVDVPLTPADLAAAFPDARGRVVVLLHGLCESDESWSRHRDRVGTTYPESLAEIGWTPVLLRANTGLPLRDNGVLLTALLRDLVAAWPVPVERIALVGHSMGGLVVRAAGAVTGEGAGTWRTLVTDVVTLGTPHLGASLARHAGSGSAGLARVPETLALAALLDRRSRGIQDLVEGLGDEVPPLPHARYRLVAAGRDLLVGRASAVGRDRVGRTLFPAAETLTVRRAGHFDLLNHPEVSAALARWLA